MSIFYDRFPLDSEPDPRRLSDKIRRQAGIGRTHWDFSLHSIPKSGVGYRKQIFDYTRNLHVHEPLGWSLLLWGSVGRGKTSIATAILKNARARRAGIMSIRCMRMINQLVGKQTAKAPDGVDLDIAAHEVQYLLLDDLIIPEHRWKIDFLEDVIVHRYDARLPTIITTNKSPDDICTELPFLASRLEERYRVVHIDGPDQRERNRAK